MNVTYYKNKNGEIITTIGGVDTSEAKEYIGLMQWVIEAFGFLLEEETFFYPEGFADLIKTAYSGDDPRVAIAIMQLQNFHKSK